MQDDPATLTCIVSEQAANGSLLTTQGAILLSAAAATAVAIIAMYIQANVARKRATLDMLMKKEWDQDYIDAKKEFNKLRDSGDIIQWAAKVHQNSDETNNIRNTLNDYEMIAVGIKHKILDEKVYKSWFESSLKKDYLSAEGFITEIRRREDNDKIFCEFQTLALSWGAKQNKT